MKLLVNLFFSFALFSSILLMSACEDDEKTQSLDTGPTPNEPEVIVEEEVDEDVPVMQLRASPQQKVVQLDWDEVDEAVDYRVTRELQRNESSEIVVYTEGVTEFSFSTSGGQSYLVEVAALDASDEVIKISKVVTVVTSSPSAILKSDQGL